MSRENATNKSATDTTSASRRGKTDLTESQYLAIEARAAKAAMTQSLSNMKRDLAETADPRVWARAHPYITIATVLVGGFAAAATLIPSKEQLQKRAEELKQEAKKKAREVPPVRVKIVDDENGDASKQKAVPTLLGIALKTIFQLSKPILMSAISAGLAARTSQPADENPADFPPE